MYRFFAEVYIHRVYINIYTHTHTHRERDEGGWVTGMGENENGRRENRNGKLSRETTLRAIGVFAGCGRKRMRAYPPERRDFRIT